MTVIIGALVDRSCKAYAFSQKLITLRRNTSRNVSDSYLMEHPCRGPEY